MEELLIQTSNEMVQFGADIGATLQAGAVVALVGDLGVGKTHFTKGVCLSQEAGDTTSPTYTLVNEMTEGNLPIFHFDFYRVKVVEELYDLGWDDYLDRQGIIVAEWADLYPELIPANALWIKIEHVEGGRKVTIAR